MVEKTISDFLENFNHAPTLFIKAPGRINLIGEHIDYYSGFVMPTAIDLYIYMAFSKSESSESYIYSSTYKENISFPVKIDRPDGHWGRFIYAALFILSSRGYRLIPFKLAINSNIPAGAGLSSSAALLCGLISGLNELNQWHLSKSEIALLAQSSEHYLGTPCGLMDQTACLKGKRNEFLFFDCLELSIQTIPIVLRDYSLLLANTMVHHTLSDGGYAKRRLEGEAALIKMNEKNPGLGLYRNISLHLLEEQADLSSTEKKRAKHAITEHTRVLDCAQAMLAKDIKKIGSILYSSHASLRYDYEVSCAEADFIVDYAANKKVTGARMMGGGFGGCVLHLIKKEMIDSYQQVLSKNYKNKFGFVPEFIPVGSGEFLIKSLV